MVVSATQIKLKGLSGYVRFFLSIRKISKQVQKADGLFFVKTKGFMTLTGWKDYESMKEFRNSGPHLEAMKNIKKMGVGKSATWEASSEPTWQEAEKMLSGVQY
jgi:hypothetical protein